mmetsp:Transcript_13874/g.30092  ORF Transcript_13874/g.30092 Transcript_13874/m.30092 type:complete len:98 (+) Transcript_13874:371-664(+)
MHLPASVTGGAGSSTDVLPAVPMIEVTLAGLAQAGVDPAAPLPVTRVGAALPSAVAQNKHQQFDDPENAAKLNVCIEQLKNHCVTPALARRAEMSHR